MTKQEIEENNKHKTILRNKIIATSSKETSEKGINIKEEILNMLKDEGFNIEYDGVKHLASLIALLFHERKLYQRLHKRESYQEYWNLNDSANEHYHMIGSSRQKVIDTIDESLKSTSDTYETIENFIFRITDDVVNLYGEEKEYIGYQKMLKN